MTSSHVPHPKSRRRFLRDVAVAGGLVLGGSLVAACQQSTSPPPAAGTAPGQAAPGQAAPGQAGVATVGDLPRNETLYIGGFQWGPPTTFNPFGTTPSWPNQGLPNTPHMHMYETLFGFNLQSGALDPLLGKELAWPDPKTAVVTLQSGAQWQDGQPLNADDVIYTYELGKKYKDLFFGTFWDYVSGITATNASTLQFNLMADRLNPGIVKQYLATVYVVPKHIWQARESAGSPTSATDTEPIGSGPYKLQTASPERVVLVRNDSYWGNATIGTPKPRYIVHPIFKSNDDGNLAFQRGELDLSQQFAPQIWQMWDKQKLPIGTWFKQEPYYLPGQLPIMHINVQKKGLDNTNVRRALAYAINYAQIAATAMSRYSVPAKSSLLVAGGIEQKFMDDASIAAGGWTFDVQKATQILESEGAKKGSDGVYVLPDGTRLGPWKAMCPYGWTDWMTSLELVSQGAKAAGMDITTEFPEAPIVNTRVGNADFDLAMWAVSGVSPASPWLRYRDILDSRGVPAAGQRAFWNFNRYSNPAVGSLLDQAAAATSEADQKRLYGELDKIFMQDVPSIPLMYRPLEFYEFNQSVWSGFPTSDNPVSPPTQSGAGIKVLSQIQAKS
jgi:peptide/nickel transport system substrate-binding protein